MATISITIADADLSRVIHALCVEAALPDSGPNARTAVIGVVRDIVSKVERNEAFLAAQIAANSAIDVTIS